MAHPLLPWYRVTFFGHSQDCKCYIHETFIHLTNIWAVFHTCTYAFIVGTWGKQRLLHCDKSGRSMFLQLGWPSSNYRIAGNFRRRRLSQTGMVENTFLRRTLLWIAHCRYQWMPRCKILRRKLSQIATKLNSCKIFPSKVSHYTVHIHFYILQHY